MAIPNASFRVGNMNSNNNQNFDLTHHYRKNTQIKRHSLFVAKRHTGSRKGLHYATDRKNARAAIAKVHRKCAALTNITAVTTRTIGRINPSANINNRRMI